MFLAIAINDTINKGQNYKSGLKVLENMENKTFASKTMRCTPENSKKKKKKKNMEEEKSRTTSRVVVKVTG